MNEFKTLLTKLVEAYERTKLVNGVIKSLVGFSGQTTGNGDFESILNNLWWAIQKLSIFDFTDEGNEKICDILESEKPTSEKVEMLMGQKEVKE